MYARVTTAASILQTGVDANSNSTGTQKSAQKSAQKSDTLSDVAWNHAHRTARMTLHNARLATLAHGGIGGGGNVGARRESFCVFRHCRCESVWGGGDFCEILSLCSFFFPCLDLYLSLSLSHTHTHTCISLCHFPLSLSRPQLCVGPPAAADMTRALQSIDEVLASDETAPDALTFALVFARAAGDARRQLASGGGVTEV